MKVSEILHQSPDDVKGDSALEDWFRLLLNKEFEKISLADIGVCLRQGILIEKILPKVFQILKDDINSGEKYDGEILVALATLEKRDFESNIDYLKKLGQYVLSQKDLIEPTVMDEALAFLKSLGLNE